MPDYLHCFCFRCDPCCDGWMWRATCGGQWRALAGRIGNPVFPVQWQPGSGPGPGLVSRTTAVYSWLLRSTATSSTSSAPARPHSPASLTCPASASPVMQLPTPVTGLLLLATTTGKPLPPGTQAPTHLPVVKQITTCLLYTSPSPRDS